MNQDNLIIKPENIPMDMNLIAKSNNSLIKVYSEIKNFDLELLKKSLQAQKK